MANTAQRKSTRRRTITLSVAASLLLGVSIFVGFVIFAHNMNANACQENLHNIGLAILLYENENQHEYPDSFQHLLIAQSLDANGLICPASHDTPATSPTTRALADDILADGHLSYIYVGQGLTENTATAKMVVAHEPLSNHWTGMNVLFGDGHVEWENMVAAKALIAKATR